MPKFNMYKRRKAAIARKANRRVQNVIGIGRNGIRGFTSSSFMKQPNLKNQLYPYIIHDQSAPVTQTAAGQHLNLTVRMDNISNFAEYASLYDQYKILKCSVTFHPVNQQPANTTTTALGVNEIFFAVVVDLDNSDVLTTYDNYFEYSNVKYQRVYDQRRLTQTFVPHTRTLVNSTAGNDYMNNGPRWIDCSAGDAIHFGIKYYVPQASVVTTNAQSWLISSKVWVMFRNTR